MMPAALVADLHLLSALSGRAQDLEGLVRGMSGDLKVAIPSAIGLSLTVRISGQDVTLTTLEDHVGCVRASIHFPLGTASVNEGSCIVFYAATPGAFVDLAADLGWTTGLSEQIILLDQHLHVPAEGSAMTGLREFSTMNQAIGMLIGRGNSAESARAELERYAESRCTTVQMIAADFIHEIRAGGPMS